MVLRNSLIGVGVVLGLSIPAYLVLGTVRVQEGEVGVRTTFGKAGDAVLPPGLHTRVPLAQSLVRINTRLNRTDAPNLSAASKDNQAVFLSLTVNWSITNDDALGLFQEIGTNDDVSHKIINPLVSTIAKQATINYSAVEILNNRQAIETWISEQVSTVLEQRYNLSGVTVALTDVSFSDAFEAELERTQEAAQQALTAAQVEQVAIAQAAAEVAKARGEAEAARLRSEALQASGGELVVLQQAIEAWKEGGSQVPLVLGSDGMILNLESLVEPQPAQ